MFFCELLKILDNTFIGTFFAGILIAYFGLRNYHRQKELDIKFHKKNRLQELSTSLLTHLSVAAKDYIGTVSQYV